MKLAMSASIPEHLEPPESLLFAQIQREFCITDSGGIALLTAACESRGRARRCRERIDREGELTPEGKVHPLLLCERDSRKAFVSTINALGLDTEAAGSVGVRSVA